MLNSIFCMVWYQASGVGWGYYGNTPGCSLAIVCTTARLLPPPWSSTASASLLHVGFPNLSTWRERTHVNVQDCQNMSNRSRGAGTGAHLQQVVALSMELHRTIHVGFHGLQGMTPLTATHFQGEAMAVTTKYRERLHHSQSSVLNLVR